jgi:hypothetical protein
VTPVPSLPYQAAPGADQPLRQCEILTNVIQTRLALVSLGEAEPRTEDLVFRYAIILTQDCELEQDHGVRFPAGQPASDKLIPSVLLAEVYTAEDMLSRIADSSKKQWERLNIAKNKNERFHFLQKAESDCDQRNEGLPELAIDFKRCFTLPTDELYRRIELGEAQRRCVLVSPYLEHLSSRFAYFLSRVALPSDHASE